MIIVIALTLLKNKLNRKNITIQCDNMVSVTAINSGSSRNRKILNCMRELHKMSALLSCEVRAVYLSTQQNRWADALSRWHFDNKSEEMLCENDKFHNRNEVQVGPEQWESVAECEM